MSTIAGVRESASPAPHKTSAEYMSARCTAEASTLPESIDTLVRLMVADLSYGAAV